MITVGDYGRSGERGASGERLMPVIKLLLRHRTKYCGKDGVAQHYRRFSSLVTNRDITEKGFGRVPLHPLCSLESRLEVVK